MTTSRAHDGNPTRRVEHHHESAGRHAIADVAVFSPDDTVERALQALRARPTSLDVVCLTDPARVLRGVVPLSRVLAADPGASLASLVERPPIPVRAGSDQEEVAHAALRQRVTSVPVVDQAGALLGVVPPLALLRILYREHAEDMHKLAGISREDEMANEALEAPPRRRARHRLPWLLVGLLGSAVATWVTASFEVTLTERIAVGFFIPAIVYLADAVGTQTEAIVVRALAHAEHRLSARRLVGGELVTGLLIGVVLGGLAFPAVSLAFGDPRLGFTVGLSIAVASSLAATIGLLLPWALHKRGVDPAFGSGPVATVIQDVLSLVVYLLIARALL